VRGFLAYDAIYVMIVQHSLPEFVRPRVIAASQANFPEEQQRPAFHTTQQRKPIRNRGIHIRLLTRPN
jgi:hypothetical protein